MGRRRLPKLDPAIDYQAHLLELDQLSHLENVPNSLFPQPQPLEVEVGSGKGLFLLNQSGADPLRNYLGIEIAKKYARFAAYRLAQHGRANARMIRGDAIEFAKTYLQPNSVEAFHVYFPDPWWKDRHRRRRVIQPDFVAVAERALIPGGRFVFWTDVEEYFESGCQTISEWTRLQGPFDDLPTAVCRSGSDHEHQPTATDTELSHDPNPRTHFDRRMKINDHPVWRCYYLKTNSATCGLSSEEDD